MVWNEDPMNQGADLLINFSQGAHANTLKTEQFPWMELQLRRASGPVTPVTHLGCCMAFTVYFFDWYRTFGDNNLNGYFQWLQKPKGIASVMNLQTKYLGWTTHGHGEAPTQETGALAMALNAVRRKGENEIYTKLGFVSVDSPFFPSLVSSLASEVMKDYSSRGCVYKPIYLATTSEAHAIGAVLDYTSGSFLFFDSNHGLARFGVQQCMKTWLGHVTPEYDASYTAFYADTKVAAATVRPRHLSVF